jgi:hypothetical protein
VTAVRERVTQVGQAHAAAIEWYQGVIRTVNQLQLQQELAIGAKNAPFLGHLYILLKIFEKPTIFTKTGSGQT